MTDVASNKYFVRIRGKIMGPFTMDQLRSLKDRGRIREEHEISENRKQWEPASRLRGLFQTNERTVSEPVQSEAETQSKTASTQWYYSRGDDQVGPLTFSQLRKMIKDGTLEANDFLWHDGMNEWKRADEVDGLLESIQPSKRDTQTFDIVHRRRSRGLTIVWDAVLSAIRNQVSDKTLDSSMTSLVKTGALAMTLTVLASAGYTLIQGIRTDSTELIVWGLLATAGISVAKYVGVHLSLAGDALIKSTDNELSSPAFLNAVAVILIFMGLLGAAIPSYYAARSETIGEKLILFTLAIQMLVVFVLSTYPALHPGWMNIKIVTGARCGEDGVSVWSFILKLQMRSCAISFGTGSILSAIGLSVSLCFQILGEEWFMISATIAFLSVCQAFIAGLMPLLGYLVMVLGSILLDVAQSIIKRSTPRPP